MPTFGNTEIGDEYVHYLNGDIWGTVFKAPEVPCGTLFLKRFLSVSRRFSLLFHAKSITMYVKAGNAPIRVRGSLYQEFTENMRKRFRFVMATEEKTIPAQYEGSFTFNFTAPPPLSKGVKYWINGWADEYGIIQISTKKTPGIYQSAEWTTYMYGQPHGLGYPRFYEIIPQSIRKACICSIYCTYDYELPEYYKCPYCGSHFATYAEVLEHIKTTPIEMIHLHICPKCGKTHYLKGELDLHMYQAHQIGTIPSQYSCIFCTFTRPTTKEIYDHINALS